MAILEPLDEEMPQPKILFKSSARILTQSLRQAIRDADLVSEHVKIEAPGDMLKMRAVGDIGSAFSEWERRAVIIKAEGELQASEKLMEASSKLEGSRYGYALRTLSTISDVS